MRQPGFPQNQIASGSGRDAGCLCSEPLRTCHLSLLGIENCSKGGKKIPPPHPPLCVLGACEEWNQVMKNSDGVFVN